MQSIEPLPYRLPELLAANSSKPVFIAEGEKDCNNIIKLGLIATCNHIGAKKWRREISKWLKGYDAVILPDNDEKGRGHVEDVAKKLKGIAKRIRVLALPDLPEKGDISDWIAGGGTAERLLQMAEDAPDWTPTNAVPDNATPEAVADDFKRNDGGGIVANSQHNVRLAIRKLGVRLSHDVFADQLLIDGLEGSNLRPLGDVEMVRLYLLVDETFKFRAGKEFFWDVAADAARQAAFHPVRQYFDSLVWDRVPRIHKWLTTYAGAEDNTYTQAVGRLVLVAAVLRIRHPGAKFDEMMVLESGQGLNKSTALRTLAVRDEWFSDDLPLNCESKEVIERLHGKWIVEAAELRGMRQGEIEHVKSFLSRIEDRARPAYGRLPITKRRQCIFIGSTNSTEYLKDPTGNRRFWPVRVEQFDIESLWRDRDQLWAEAVAAEATGESVRLDPELYGAATEQQEQRRVDDPWVTLFEDALANIYGRMRCADVWTIVNVKPENRTQVHNQRLGETMKILGWRREKQRFDGKAQWGYVKDGSPDDPSLFDTKWPRITLWRDSEGGLHVTMAEKGADGDSGD
jgi:predicted P-loop ATPase